MLPYPGGFDDLGNLTMDPEIILKNEKALPIGYWKDQQQTIQNLQGGVSEGDNRIRKKHIPISKKRQGILSR